MRQAHFLGRRCNVLVRRVSSRSKGRLALSITRCVRTAVLVAAASVFCGCGSSSPANTITITISNYTFSPSSLSVKPGTTITVVNDDTVQHTLTSEAALGNYVAGGVSGISFDTGPFAGPGSRTVTIPTTANPGTVIPYFCTVHLSMMGQGTITVVGQ